MSITTATLSMLSGESDRDAVAIGPGEAATIGRADTCDFVLDDAELDAEHARFSFEADGIWIEDSAHALGVFVNGDKTSRRRLATEDIVLLGSTVLRVEIEGDDPGGLIAQTRWLLESGPNRGQVIGLDQGRYILGRDETEADLYFDDDEMAPRVAQVDVGAARVTIQPIADAGSVVVDGTPVAGRTTLGEGTAVEIGNTALRLVTFVKGGSETVMSMSSAAIGPGVLLGAMAGQLREISLPEVLQMLAAGQRTGGLVVEDEGTKIEIYLRRGRIVGVLDPDMQSDAARDAMMETMRSALALESGTFRFDPALIERFDSPIDADVNSLLMDLLS